ncbi:Flavin-linked sulfhydryl oxidase of the mitochondrial IMS [Cladophialophora chaetospira]|uniref:Sulfhydryl oxidase n=1 Tax=Cladophialophora chaetospira TaxID=386627 RepID=A0AA38XDT1_9EURO|nr:Flavin-linked sulfhydryl oxidase of the mitochondrial IMS [Cladophialophora chaetospira]
MSFPFLPGKVSGSKEQSRDNEETPQQKTAPGVVLGKDGKPCRTCTSSAAWMAMMKSGGKKPKPAAVPTAPPSDCPPDVEELGRSTWMLLHSMAATYPEVATPETQSIMKQFISTFSRLYPCYVCAEDFQGWLKEPGNEPKVKGQDELGLWACQAHNAVNVKLGKPEFDCSLWKQRWKDGWKDGRCD